MAKKKKHEKEPNHERWLVSYADFITLLFAVFVTLYAMGQSDKKKVEEVMRSMQESFGFTTTHSAPKPAVIDSSDLRILPSIAPDLTNKGKSQGGMAKGKARAEEKDFRSIKTAIEAFLIKQGAQEKVSVGITRRGLVVSLKEAGFFDSGSAIVKESAYPLLAKVAESLSGYSNALRVEGHTDTIPISSPQFPSNWELSTTRATNIVHYLTRSYDFEPGLVSAAGFGEYRPIADNATADGRAKNRRVDIVLLSGEGEKAEPEKMP
ncbi:flagellar motor protein MotB [Geobacter pickeringii]|uniref:Flagellar basal body stator protein MotB n=1 Tax=Geobacter pickeringii TaxID=345632 RepID=A0A0B5BBP3_9BACT|nr:flagellar motor protein MotB [Geobacter pickeringii]AJE02404.1 flagellar basal body stator protein MotB [Geobacter pickeringii]